MDYEVFLVSRIREFWLQSARTRVDNDESVALGIARTGRVVTAAAVVMSISFAALIAAQVSFMRMFGLGLTLAILVDATLVRMVLLPAFMHVMGEWNWWAPKWMTKLHDRFGIEDGLHSERPMTLARHPIEVEQVCRPAGGVCRECDCSRACENCQQRRYTQAEVTEALLAMPGFSEHGDFVRAVHQSAKVDGRHMVLPLEDYARAHRLRCRQRRVHRARGRTGVRRDRRSARRGGS